MLISLKIRYLLAILICKSFVTEHAAPDDLVLTKLALKTQDILQNKLHVQSNIEISHINTKSETT